jgi:hypothetical protein
LSCDFDELDFFGFYLVAGILVWESSNALSDVRREAAFSALCLALVIAVFSMFDRPLDEIVEIVKLFVKLEVQLAELLDALVFLVASLLW